MTTLELGHRPSGAFRTDDLHSAPTRWVEFCGITEQGPERLTHEDALVLGGVVALGSGARLTGWAPLTAQAFVLGVVDGMGGHPGGGSAAAVVASALATETARVHDAAWTPWFNEVSRRVADAGVVWGTARMGATAAVLAVSAGRAEVANVGDCRVYRVQEGYVGQLSVDDRPPGTSGPLVTQSLGGVSRSLDPHFWTEALPQGEVLFMVCSDGLFGAVDHAELRATLLADASTAEICDNLALAAWRGTARDNFSVLVARVGAVGAAAPSERPGITLDQT